MESNKPDDLLSVTHTNPDSGSQFTFRTSPLIDPNMAEGEESVKVLTAAEFIIYALKRIYNEPGRQSDDMPEQAAQVLPVLASILGEVVVEAVPIEGQPDQYGYNFGFRIKDGVHASNLNENDPDVSGVSEGYDFFRKLVTDCFETKVVEYVLSVYISMHRSTLAEATKRKKKGKTRLKAEPKDKRPYKVSGHLIDQKLKYFRPENGALDLFDSLRKETKDKVTQGNVERSTIVEGIRLSPSEHKVIDCLCKLLHTKSETSNETNPAYYTGNAESSVVPYGGGGRIEVAPQLAFTLYELTKEFMGGEAMGGKNEGNVYSILLELEKKKFLLSYIEKIYKKDGGRTEKKIEDFQSLIKLLTYSETDFNKKNALTGKREEIIIALNPIFRHQINSKFIEYPHDINRRTIIAYGSHNIADSSFRLRDYLMREKSYKRPSCEINLENLYWLLNEKWMREKRRKKVAEYTSRAIDTVKQLGLLQKHEVVAGSDGQQKVIFYINSEWQ